MGGARLEVESLENFVEELAELNLSLRLLDCRHAGRPGMPAVGA